MNNPALPRVAGLDTDAALARLNGNAPVYLKMLRRFLELRDVPDRIEHQLTEGQPGEAERLAHTLKGVAAGLGAERLRGQAAQLEQCLRSGRQSRSALQEVASELSRLVGALEGRLPIDSDQASALPLEELASSMSDLLENFDAQACDLLEEQSPAFQELLRERFQAFQRLTGQYQFAEAQALLQQALTERGVPGP